LPLPALAATPITTCAELQNMKDDLTGDYYLANDINCSGFDYAGDGKGFMPVGTLSNKSTGTFDGKGYKITHLYINRPSTICVGLFGCTGSGSEIENVSLEEVDVCGRLGVGGLVGRSGLYDHKITNCYSSGSVSGDGCVGGLVGFSQQLTITNSHSSGSVSGSECVSGAQFIGGLVGRSGVYDQITNCYSSSSVSASHSYSLCLGGLVGYTNGAITNCYSSGSVSGGEKVGGLVGYNAAGPITNSYSSGSVSGYSMVGGLVGYNDEAITNSYYPRDDITCTGCDNTIGNTTKAKLQNETWLTTPPNNWDFDTIWGIEEGVTYPFLQWQYAYAPAPAHDITTDKFIYKAGDTMTITIDINNPTENIVTFQWYWGVPQSDIWLPVTSVPIPAGYNDTINISFSIPNWGSTPFGNVFYVQLLDGSGEVLDADVACWAYSPGRFMEAMSVDLSKEIEKIIEKVELPT
jgi:hypothetical protein